MESLYCGTQVICTKFIGPTETKGARMCARTDNGKTSFFPYDYEVSQVENHKAACKALMIERKWSWDTAMGYYGGDAYHVRMK